MKTHPTAGLFLVFSLISPLAFAVDGVLEINHACANGLGCFGGDSANYPVTIDGSAGRSYRLTSDLIIPAGNASGIEINTSSISIDLNGFEIVGLGCEGATTDCTPLTRTGSGVRADSTYKGISVGNGSVTGMGLGINLSGDQSVVKDMRVRWNRLDGIIVGASAQINHNSVYQNGRNGIVAGVGAIIIGNIAFLNGGLNGIAAGFNSIISDNSSYSNVARGFFAGRGSTVRGNAAYDNGTDGFVTQAGCLVQGNSARGNTGLGMSLFTASGYRENVITDNDGGTVSNGIDLGNNVCGTNTTCP